MTDLDGCFVFDDDRHCQMRAQSRETLLASTVVQVAHPEDWLRNLPLFGRLLTAGDPFVIEKRYLRPDGSSMRVRNSVSGIRAADGAVQVVLAISIDITDRKAAEDAPRRSEAALSAVLDALPVGVTIVDTNGRIMRANAASKTLWGVPPEATDWHRYTERVVWWPEVPIEIRLPEDRSHAALVC
jgi:PAS domain S-box-containing protein